MSGYNYTDLVNGSNIFEWAAIVNNWGGGLPAGLLITTVILVIYGIMRKANNSVDNSLIGSSTLGLFISVTAWLITFNGMHLITGKIPFLCGTALGLSVGMKIIKGWLNG